MRTFRFDKIAGSDFERACAALRFLQSEIQDVFHNPSSRTIRRKNQSLTGFFSSGVCGRMRISASRHQLGSVLLIMSNKKPFLFDKIKCFDPPCGASVPPALIEATQQNT
jgi:hypothetical protein